MLIRRNTKAFKTLQEIIKSCQDRQDRQTLIRLYITKAGHSIEDRIAVEGTQGEAIFFYDLNFQAVQNHLKSSTHQLHLSDDVPGIYFFRSNLGTNWDETPFEFDTEIKNLFISLPDLPVTKEKGKTKEFALPPPSGEVKRVLKKEKEKKKDTPPQQAIMTISRGKQPDFKLKEEISFSDLDKITIWKGQLSKRDVLDHYDRISDHLLPYLENRAIRVRSSSDGNPDAPYVNPDSLPGNSISKIPDWVETTKIGKEKMFLCNDKEHLLFYVELGSIELAPSLSRVKSFHSPDSMVIEITTEAEFTKVIEVAIATKEILDGLKLPAMIKTNARSGLHIHIPLDTKDDFEACSRLAQYICKLIRLKIPSLVSLDESEENSYNKVRLNYSMNDEGMGAIAPYSFGGGGSSIATPLQWEELTESLQPGDFNHQTIFSRLKRNGDLFEKLFAKRTNADAQLERMKELYSFLL
jgi:bifunctional non-homologous end joining protein LigD